MVLGQNAEGPEVKWLPFEMLGGLTRTKFSYEMPKPSIDCPYIAAFLRDNQRDPCHSTCQQESTKTQPPLPHMNRELWAHNNLKSAKLYDLVASPALAANAAAGWSLAQPREKDARANHMTMKKEGDGKDWKEQSFH